MKKQCAWCGRVQDNRGTWIESNYLPSASHVICPACFAREIAKINLAGKELTSQPA